METTTTTPNRRGPRTYNVIAFWLQIVTVLVKLMGFCVYIYARFSRAWFINTRLSDDFDFHRDVFGSDCVYEKNTTKVSDCISSDSRELIEGVNFWTRYGIIADDVLPPKSELLFVGQLFHAMMVLLVIDLCLTIATCVCSGKLTPMCVFEANKKPRWNAGAKVAVFYALFSALICMIFIVVAAIVLHERHDAFFVEVESKEELSKNPGANDREGKVGKSFHAFAFAGVIYFCSTALACLTYILMINANGGINKRFGDEPAAVPLQPLANPNQE